MSEPFKPVPPRYVIGLWLAAGTLGFLLALHRLSSTLAGGVFLPADQDSFYHARRILDAIPDPLAMYQFDGRIHAPEGSWVTWPWAYDMLLACLARGLVALTGAADPMTVLAFVAPAWVFVNAALLLGVCARLRLSLPMRALALLFFAASPMTQSLHRVGMLDHHFVELTFVLAALYCGLGWFETLGDRRRAIALACVLGAAPAFHNGLFILQLPVLATLAWLWALKRPIDRGGALAFAVALAAASAVFLLPSEPFRRGDFVYYLHSGFHLYVAACTGLLCVLASRVRRAPAALAALAAVLALMALPVLPQLEHGRDFLFGRHPYLRQIAEFGSVAREVAAGGWWPVTRFYSPLVWLLPLGIGGLFWRLRRRPDDASIHFLVQALIGSFLMLQTYRLHYFGSFALILPICRLIDDLRAALPAGRGRALALAAFATAAVAPGILEMRDARRDNRDDLRAALRGLYRELGAACAQAPGAVLADPNDGHSIRFYTECSSISDNFLTTPQHLEKITLTAALMAGPASEVMRQAPFVRYLFVRRADDLREGGCGLHCAANDGLRRELLLAGETPPRLRLLVEVQLQRAGGAREPLARLYAVLPPPS